VVDTANLTISEYFGHVASKDGTCSFAVVEVRAADSAAFQTPAFAEYVICNQGIIELEHSDGEVVRVEPGQCSLSSPSPVVSSPMASSR
jgi:hypothetical protein